MKNLYFLIAISLVVSASIARPTSAAIVDTGATTPVTITGVYSYSDFGGGDVVFTIATTIVGCEAGFWLRPTDPGFQRNLAMAMSAQLAGKSVRIGAYNDSLWPGSGAKYCRLYYIGIL
jgi:hypothetical protein